MLEMISAQEMTFGASCKTSVMHRERVTQQFLLFSASIDISEGVGRIYILEQDRVTLRRISWGRAPESSGINDTLTCISDILMRIIHIELDGWLGRGSLPSLFVFNHRNWNTE
jgi:hypothetical protein